MSIKIDIISGFLGAGKTTLINKILPQITASEKVALIENEFGDIGIDGSMFEESGVNVTEINSGCICCTLFGDFVKALIKLIDEYDFDRILIEPTGVGMLSDVVKACDYAIPKVKKDAKINLKLSVIDPEKFEMYNNLFGDFFKDQISSAETLILSRSQLVDSNTIDKTCAELRKQNEHAGILTDNWNELSAVEMLALIDCERSIHENSDKDDVEHHQEGHHHKNEFDYCSIINTKPMSSNEMKALLESLSTNREYGIIARSKGVFKTDKGKLLQFDYVPGDFKCFEPKKEKAENGFIIIGQHLEGGLINKCFIM
jgi:G3E family GTPase